MGPSIKRPRVPPAQVPKGPGSAQGPPRAALRGRLHSTQGSRRPPGAAPAIHPSPMLPLVDRGLPAPWLFPALRFLPSRLAHFQLPGGQNVLDGREPADEATQPCSGHVSLWQSRANSRGNGFSRKTPWFRIGKLLILLTRQGMSPRANQNLSVVRSATKGQGFGSHRGQESPASAKHQHPSLPSLKLARGSVWKSLFFLGSMYLGIRHALPLPGATAQSVRKLLDGVFGGVFLWVECLRALGAASVRGMDGSLAISMQKEGFPGVLFCLGFHPLQLGRYLFTWLSRVLSDHHYCERQFQLPGSHPQGISDKPTTPHTTHHTGCPCLANVCRCRGWWVREGIQTQYRRH